MKLTKEEREEIKSWNLFYRIYEFIQRIFFFLTQPLWWVATKWEDKYGY